MTPTALAEAAGLIETARRTARLLGALPESCRPASLGDSYNIQAELAQRAGGVAGWKIGALAPAQQARLGVDRPLAAPLLAPLVHASPAHLHVYRFIAPMIECEFAFALVCDLPPRPAPYDRAEVDAAVGALHPAIEIADARLGPAPAAPSYLADCMANGAFICGPAYPAWRALDLPRQAVVLHIDGREVARGAGAAIAGDPFAAVVALANAQPSAGEGLKAGQIITTGSCTGMLPIVGGSAAVADFGPLGEVRLTMEK
ncbi:MAG: hypothetical protein HY057_03445 [Rhodospirillales bacterium]|nr:hypothetical protein [Rhodospirillales bacterium]